MSFMELKCNTHFESDIFKLKHQPVAFVIHRNDVQKYSVSLLRSDSGEGHPERRKHAPEIKKTVTTSLLNPTTNISLRQLNVLPSSAHE